MDKASQEFKDLCLARYIANSADPRGMMARVSGVKEKPEVYVEYMRELIRVHGRVEK